MASAQQLIGLVKSHAEGDEERFFDLAMQLAAAEEQRGHTRLAEQLRQWAEASRVPKTSSTAKLTPLAAPPEVPHWVEEDDLERRGPMARARFRVIQGGLA